MPIRWGVLDTTLCDRVCLRFVAGQWFSLGTPVSSINKTDGLKLALNTMTIWKERFEQWWSQFHQYQQNKQLNQQKTKTYGIGNSYPGLGQAQRCGRIKLVNEIPTLSLPEIIGSPTEMQISTNNKNCSDSLPLCMG